MIETCVRESLEVGTLKNFIFPSQSLPGYRMSVSTKKSVSLRDESTVSTAGMSDEDIEFPILKLRVGAPKLDIQHLDLGAGTVLSRYYAVIKAIKPHWLKYSSLGVAYELNQIIATDVTNDILEILPSLVGNVFVKCEVVNGELFIVDLSAGEVHGAAVNNLCYQVNNWNDTNGAAFNVWSDTINNPLSQNHGTAPDVALTPFSLYSNTPNDSSRIGMSFSALNFILIVSYQPVFIMLAAVIIELEASHRSVKQMRERYLTYFNNNPRLFSVVGVKFFGVGKWVNTQFDASLITYTYYLRILQLQARADEQ